MTIQTSEPAFVECLRQTAAGIPSIRATPDQGDIDRGAHSDTNH